MLFLLLSNFIVFSATYNFVESAYSDQLMKKGECQKAYIGYFNDFKKSKNPILASNLALSLFCLKKYDEALKYIKIAANKIDEIDSIKTKQEILFNLAHIYSYNYEFAQSQSILSKIDEKTLSKKDIYFFTRCMNFLYLNDYLNAKISCDRAISYNNKDCSISNLNARVLYYLGQYKSANNFFSKKKCLNHESAYFYALSLYKNGDKKKAKLVLSNHLSDLKNKNLFEIMSKD